MTELEKAHETLRGMGLEPLRPPLYWKNWRGDTQRIWTPTAPRRAEIRAEVYVRDNFTCQGCGGEFDHPAAETYDGVRNVDGLTLGHIVDYRFGGPYEVANLRAECRVCNLGDAYMVPKGTPSRESGRLDGAYGEVVDDTSCPTCRYLMRLMEMDPDWVTTKRVKELVSTHNCDEVTA